MARKRATDEEIVSKLRQVDVLTAQGKTVAEVVRTIAVTEVTYYRWRKEYGGLKGDQVKRLKELEAENARLRRAVSEPDAGQDGPGGGSPGKLLSPARRRACVDHVVEQFGISQRRACRVLGQYRSTQRKAPKIREDEAALTADIMALATRYGRYGYRRITAMLHRTGWMVNHKRVERIRRREGLKVPQKQPKRGRLWLNDVSCIRLRPEHPIHVWSYDFVEGRTEQPVRLHLVRAQSPLRPPRNGPRQFLSAARPPQADPSFRSIGRVLQPAARRLPRLPTGGRQGAVPGPQTRLL